MSHTTMQGRRAERILIAGGAGLIGSHLAAELCADGRRVTVVDGLLPRTGGARRNVERLLDRIRFVDRRVEDVTGLGDLIGESDVVVDCMGWTCHRAAMEDPEYDRELNLASHLVLLRALRGGEHPRFVYLGSRAQYGRPGVSRITEDCPLQPVDMLGIHKTAAEQYYRLYTGTHGLNVASLRFAACVGRGQPTAGPDIGLFGGFTRDLLLGGTVSVYGSGRTRLLTDVNDLTTMVRALIDSPWQGFEAFNIPGQVVPLDFAARLLQRLAGRGEVQLQAMPADVASIDIGEGEPDCRKLEALIGRVVLAPVEETLQSVVDYFRGEIG